MRSRQADCRDSRVMAFLFVALLSSRMPKSAAQIAASSTAMPLYGSFRPLNVRVDDLISRMTLEEKVSSWPTSREPFHVCRYLNMTGGVRPSWCRPCGNSNGLSRTNRPGRDLRSFVDS